MEIHDRLYELGRQVGREVFDDSGRLGPTLDEAARQGEVSHADADLLLKVVRTGAYRSMLDSIAAGTDPADAARAAGDRFGTGDPGAVARAQWALAVLGYAMGQLSESDVARFRSRAQAATPPARPPSQQPYQAAGAPGTQPSWSPGQPAGHSGSTGSSGPHGSSGARSRTGLFVGIGAAAVAVVLAVVLAIVLTNNGGDDEPKADPTTTSQPPTTDPTTEETTETTTAPPTDRISDEAANGYTDALNQFSVSFGKASDKQSRASTNDNFPQALEASAEMRKSVYDFDLAVRDLDLDPIYPEVNHFLTVSAEMIDGLDESYQTAKSAFDLNVDFIALPTTEYTDAFTAIATAIANNRQ
ncbi:hypothetical protein [Nocardioides sp. GXZ039]|uniref:hypothetical protein n=1 Tax=Nocardioides sp. GXZ039 TaxID=3136018 RepID=UPI0030F3A4EA